VFGEQNVLPKYSKYFWKLPNILGKKEDETIS